MTWRLWYYPRTADSATLPLAQSSPGHACPQHSAQSCCTIAHSPLQPSLLSRQQPPSPFGQAAWLPCPSRRPGSCRAAQAAPGPPLRCLQPLAPLQESHLRQCAGLAQQAFRLRAGHLPSCLHHPAETMRELTITAGTATSTVAAAGQLQART